MWPLGQAVKTPPFHGGNRGSIPLGVTILRSHSSAGRAPALQAGGHRFDPCCDHHKTFNGSVAQLVRVPACHAGGRGFEPLLSRQFWPLGQAVKTPPFHGGNRGSIPLGVTIYTVAQLSWESTCLTSRGSQVRSLLRPPKFLMAQQLSWLECRPVTPEVEGSSPF